MKILHLVHNYYPSIGGSQLMYQQFSENLVKMYGDKVTLFTTNAMFSPHASHNQFVTAGMEIINGVEVHRFPFNSVYPRVYQPFKRLCAKIELPIPCKGFFNLLNAGPISLPMFLSVLKTQADVISSTAVYYLNSYYPIISKKFGKSTPLIIFGALHLHEREISPTVLWAIKRADAYIAHTQFEMDYLVEKGIATEKIYIIGAGINMDDFSNADGSKIRQRYNIADDPVVLFLGRQAPYKGIVTLLYAMRMVWKTSPNAYLIIAGSETQYTGMIEEIWDTCSFVEKQHIILSGSIPENEKTDFYAACDIFVTISSQESFGIVYIEAWACRKPVIGGRIGAVSDLIRDGIDGKLVEIGNVAQLADTINTLLSNPKMRQSMGQQGYHRVQEEFTWEVLTQKLRNIYEVVIQKVKP